MTDNPRQGSARDDFFRASALQLLTALIADVCLSGHTEKKDQHLRQVRANLSEPEPKLRQRLQTIYDNSESGFVKENVAPFIAMTPETFSGVYANAVKETHWLSPMATMPPWCPDRASRRPSSRRAGRTSSSIST
ncbi:type IV secretory pathway TraG/TraD family ATPase VirD4 [Bradyrhizobium japonicum]